jgi:hypothetical protein
MLTDEEFKALNDAYEKACETGDPAYKGLSLLLDDAIHEWCERRLTDEELLIREAGLTDEELLIDEAWSHYGRVR